MKTMDKLRVVFMGTPEFAVPVLKKLIENCDVVLVVSQPDALVGRKKILTPSPISMLASENGIEVYKPNKIKNEYEYILNKKPDIIITCAYGQIVPKQILDYPDYGCINVHASLLPKYRGASPITAAIQNDEKTTGVTLMYMEEGLDTGNIIHAKEISIEEDDTLGTLSEKLSHLGAELLIKTLPKILEDENFDIPQNEEDATYVGLIKREMERCDFSKTRREVYNFIRSLNPSPLANTLINGEEWKIIECKIGSKKEGEISHISSINKDSFGIMCSDGEILVTKVKPAGKKEMRVLDLFNGYDKEKLKNIEVGK